LHSFRASRGVEHAQAGRHGISKKVKNISVAWYIAAISASADAVQAGERGEKERL